MSKGGNLLLNIAPGPDGAWHPEAYDRLRDIGAWMTVNGDAIYGTISPKNGNFRTENMVFTQKGDKTYAIYLAQEGEEMMPDQIRIPNLKPKSGSKIILLGSKNSPRWRVVGNDLMVWPDTVDVNNPPGRYAWVFEVFRETRE